MYDQLYWAERVQQLGIGRAHAPGAPSTESLKTALREALAPDVAVRARVVSAAVRADGAENAARALIAEATRS
jgi:vancomycin aglycone glucosyltransferase